MRSSRQHGWKESRVAGRTWRIETDHHLSVSFDKRDEVLAACQELGLDTNVLTTVNTAKLKAMLKEAAQEAGKDSSLPFSQGTALEGICGSLPAFGCVIARRDVAFYFFTLLSHGGKK